MAFYVRMLKEDTGEDHIAKASPWFSVLPDINNYIDGDRVGLFGTGDYVATEINPIGPVRAWVIDGQYATNLNLQTVTDNGNTTTNDMEYTDTTKGTIMTSPDGTRWRQTIGNDGIPIYTSL